MKCRDCEYWTENMLGFVGVYRTESGWCHIEPKKIPKNGDDFCGKHKQRVYVKEAKQ